MSCTSLEQDRPSRRKEMAAFFAISATALLYLATTPSNTIAATTGTRKLWAQNIYWAGNPNDVPPPPAPPPPAKPPKHYYQPVPAAPRPPPKGNPFEKFGEAGSASETVDSSSYSGLSSDIVGPSPPPPPPPPPVPVSQPTPSGVGAISSNSYYSRPNNQYSAPVEDEVSQQMIQAFVAQDEPEIQQFSHPVQEQEEEEAATAVVVPAAQQGFSGTLGPPAETPAQSITPQQTYQQHAAPSIQSTTITSSIQLSEIPSPLPPSGSMERTALLNSLVERIDSMLTSMMDSGTEVKDIKILSVGGVDLTRRLRANNNSPVSNGINADEKNLDRSLWTTTQVVKFEALLDYICGDETEESCMDNAQSSFDEIMTQLEPTETTSTTTSSYNSFVDNEGEDWSTVETQEPYVNLPDISVDFTFEMITDSPSAHPTSIPTTSPTSQSTTHPSSSPTSSPQSMQSYSVNIEIDTQTNEPTSAPTTPKPNSPSASSELFVGDASKRYCGFDWVDVTTNCLTATPCPQGHAEGVCPYGQTCIADTPCDEIRAQAETDITSITSVSTTLAPETTENMVETTAATAEVTMSVITTTTATLSSSAPNFEAEQDNTASKRFCGYDWANVVQNCLIATPCPEGLADVCPNGMQCIDSTPCDEVRAQNADVVQARQPVQEAQPVSSTATSSSSAATTQVMEQVHDQDMGMMMANTNPSPDIHEYETSCVVHGDCSNQLCGLPHSGFEGTCVDCLFTNHIGCRASEICVISSETGMPSCQEQPNAATIITTIPSTTTTTSTSETSQTTESSIASTTIPTSTSETYSSPQAQYQNPRDNNYFCGKTYSIITDMCLQSRPCPTGVAAIHCEHEEGCFAHLECQAKYEEVGATTVDAEGSDSLNAFAAFETSEWRTTEGEADESSFWATTWNNSAQGTSCAMSYLATSTLLLLMLQSQ